MGSFSASTARVMIGVGVVLVIIGAAILIMTRLGWTGRLPGDITVRGKSWLVWIPITTSIVLSIVLTIILNLIGRR